MSRKWRWVIGGGLALCGFGFWVGVLADRVRPDRQRTALTRYDAAEHQWPSYTPLSLELEQKRAAMGPQAKATPWTARLQKVDEALAANNVSAAERAWHDAYVSALGTRRWEGMVEVGDAYLRIGEVAKGRKAAEAKARQAYLTALFRARNEGSLDGVLRSLQAFAALGDREVLERGLYIAERLAAATPDLEARARVRAVREQLAGQFSATGP